MSKWADYGISKVRYNSAHTHIDKVIIKPDNDTSFGGAIEYSRQQVITAIKNRYTFITITTGASGQWQKGQPVKIITVMGVEYIKTADNGKEADNLENLPEF